MIVRRDSCYRESCRQECVTRSPCEQVDNHYQTIAKATLVLSCKVTVGNHMCDGNSTVMTVAINDFHDSYYRTCLASCDCGFRTVRFDEVSSLAEMTQTYKFTFSLDCDSPTVFIRILEWNIVNWFHNDVWVFFVCLLHTFSTRNNTSISILIGKWV